jgi:hypothetical protein
LIIPLTLLPFKICVLDYRLELLSKDKFEDLVNIICQKLFGMGVIVFADGKDGGRDGKFEGRAESFPSSIENWEGKFIIQSKHTNNPIASCSENDFGKIVEDEIVKIKKLKSNGEIDHYILFTNRKHPAITTSKLEAKIKNDTKITNAVIVGKETINKQYLHPHRHIVKMFGLDLFTLPFDFSDSDLQDLVIAFRDELSEEMEDLIRQESEKIKHNYYSIDKQEKNEKNNLGKEYYDNIILKDSLKYFTKIDEFLRNPINKKYKNYYFDIVAELNQIITIKREDFGVFEEIFGFIYMLMVDDKVALKGKKRFIQIFLHYMYFNCDLGKK